MKPGKHRVTVSPLHVRDRSRPGLAPLLKRTVRTALTMQGVDALCTVEVLYTGDRGIQQLNREFRRLDRPTDVLSFPLLELAPGQLPQPAGDTVDPDTGTIPLGTVVINLDQVERQAQEYGNSFEREAAYLCIHSVLHLLGYDHERGPREDRQQRQRTNEIIEELEI